MELLSKHDRGDFSLYFLAFNNEGRELTQEEKTQGVFAREGNWLGSIQCLDP